MQCFFDQLIGDMRPIEVAGVDVIDSEPNDLAQDCDRAVVIFRWPEYMWTSQLHGAVAHSSQDQIIGKLECAAGQGGGGDRFQIRNYELRIRKNENREHRRYNVQWRFYRGTGAQFATPNVVSTISTASEQRMIPMTRTRMAAPERPMIRRMASEKSSRI